MRDQPRTGKSATLVVEPESESDAVAAAVDDLGGTVVRALPFGALLVDLPQGSVAPLCVRDDIARIETGDTLGHGLGDG